MNQLVGLKKSGVGDESAGFQSAEESLRAWFGLLDATCAVATRKRYKIQVRKFVAAWDELPWELSKADIWRYIELYSQGCTNFRTNIGAGRGEGCTKGLVPSNCSAECPLYASVKVQTIGAHLQAVAAYYRFLEQRNMVSVNVLERVKREWAKQSKHRHRSSNRRIPTKEEIRVLLRGTLPNHAAVLAVMAKCGTRIGETLSLRVDSEHFERGRWLVIPDVYGKRRGNRRLVIDAELWSCLEPYLSWRVERMRVNGQEHAYLFVKGNGEPFCQGADPSGDFNAYLRLDQERLGLAEGGNHFTAHAFRHFFSDELKRNGCEDFYWHLLRGDVPRHNMDVYLHPKPEELRKHYLASAPRFY